MTLDKKPRRQQITPVLHIFLTRPLVVRHDFFIDPPRSPMHDFDGDEQVRVAVGADARGGQRGVQRLPGLLQVGGVLAVDGVVVGQLLRNSI